MPENWQWRSIAARKRRGNGCRMYDYTRYHGYDAHVDRLPVGVTGLERKQEGAAGRLGSESFCWTASTQ